MKAQLAVEFLFNFLAFLALISILLAAFSHFLAASKIFASIMLEKARVEEFARTLDLSESIRHEKFFSDSNYSISSGENETCLITETNDSGIRAYTIYGIGEDYGEPV